MSHTLQGILENGLPEGLQCTCEVRDQTTFMTLSLTVNAPTAQCVVYTDERDNKLWWIAGQTVHVTLEARAAKDDQPSPYAIRVQIKNEQVIDARWDTSCDRNAFEAAWHALLRNPLAALTDHESHGKVLHGLFRCQPIDAVVMA